MSPGLSLVSEPWRYGEVGVVVWVLAVIGVAALCLVGWVVWLVWDEERHRSRRSSRRPGARVRLVPGGGPEVERAAVMRRVVEVRRQQDAAVLGAALAMLVVARSFLDDQP